MDTVPLIKSDDMSFLLPELSAFDGSAIGKGDVKPCPPTPKRIRRTAFNAELDESLTLLSFSSKDEKKRGSDFVWGTSIGAGALNEGWSVTSKDIGEKSALLKSKQKMASLNERRVIVSSFKNLRRLLLADGAWHPHILVHYSLWQENGYLFLHSELCEKGDLGRLLDDKGTGGLLTESDIWEVVKQLLPTLHFMHSRGVLHMDIKPANIYLTRHDVMKIGDFGTSVCRDLWKQECDIHEGDAHYLAVEVLRDHILSPAADIFSFGMTLHRLVTGYCVGTSYLSDKSSFLKNPRFTVSNQLTTLIMSMIHPNFQERARSDQLMSCLGLLSSPSSSPSSSPASSPRLSIQDDDDLMSLSSSSSDQPSPSSSCSSSSSSFMMSKQSPSPPACSRRMILSPKTPTIDKTKRKRRIGRTGRPRSLRDL